MDAPNMSLMKFSICGMYTGRWPAVGHLSDCDKSVQDLQATVSETFDMVLATKKLAQRKR